MKISVTAPAAQMAEYLRQVADHVDQGYLGGHVDETTHFATEEVYDK